MTTPSYPTLAAATIQDIANGFTPKVGIVLGSGLGDLASELVDTITIDYQRLAGFPKVSVKGHQGKLHLGYLNGVAVACLQGRAHSYENLSYEEVKTYVRTLKLLGCEYFIATNASGSLHEDIGPGELMLIKDHINFQPGNPLAGPNDDEFGPRFPPMDKAYHPEVLAKLKKHARDSEVNLHEGVYISVLGPCYETAAEIKAFRILGADAVGMSTVPEVIVANHCGMKVGVIATITNYATGLAAASHNHDAVVSMAARAAVQLKKIIVKFVGDLDD